MRLLPNAEWLVELNPETMPRVLVNEAYHARVSAGIGREGRTLPRREPVQRQLAGEIAAAAGEHHPEGRRPRSCVSKRGIFPRRRRPSPPADACATSRSRWKCTRARSAGVTANKYMATPRGVFELKYFFTTAIQRRAWRREPQRRGRAASHSRPGRRGGPRGRSVGRRYCVSSATGRRRHRAPDRGQIPRSVAHPQLSAAQTGESRAGRVALGPDGGGATNGPNSTSRGESDADHGFGQASRTVGRVYARAWPSSST